MNIFTYQNIIGSEIIYGKDSKWKIVKYYNYFDRIGRSRFNNYPALQLKSQTSKKPKTLIIHTIDKCREYIHNNKYPQWDNIGSVRNYSDKMIINIHNNDVYSLPPNAIDNSILYFYTSLYVNEKSAQQVDAPEPATMVDSALQTLERPAR